MKEERRSSVTVAIGFMSAKSRYPFQKCQVNPNLALLEGVLDVDVFRPF